MDDAAVVDRRWHQQRFDTLVENRAISGHGFAKPLNNAAQVSVWDTRNARCIYSRTDRRVVREPGLTAHLSVLLVFRGSS